MSVSSFDSKLRSFFLLSNSASLLTTFVSFEIVKFLFCSNSTGISDISIFDHSSRYLSVGIFFISAGRLLIFVHELKFSSINKFILETQFMFEILELARSNISRFCILQIKSGSFQSGKVSHLKRRTLSLFL